MNSLTLSISQSFKDNRLLVTSARLCLLKGPPSSNKTFGEQTNLSNYQVRNSIAPRMRPLILYKTEE